jgi:hypothetical protein
MHGYNAARLLQLHCLRYLPALGASSGKASSNFFCNSLHLANLNLHDSHRHPYVHCGHVGGHAIGAARTHSGPGRWQMPQTLAAHSP